MLEQILVISIILNLFFILATLRFPQWLRIAFSKALMIVVRNDRVVDVVPAKYDAGTFRNKNYGRIKPEPDDVVIFNRKPCVIAYSAYSKPVRAKIMPLLRKLKELGLETYADLQRVLWVARNKHLLSTDGGNLTEEQLKVKEQLEKLPPVYYQLAEYIDNLERGGYLPSDIEVIRPSDLINYVEEENPLVLEGIVEREIEKVRRKYRNPVTNLMPYVIMFIMLILGVAIAWKIISSGGVSAVQNAASNLPINVK